MKASNTWIICNDEIYAYVRMVTGTYRLMNLSGIYEVSSTDIDFKDGIIPRSFIKEWKKDGAVFIDRSNISEDTNNTIDSTVEMLAKF